MEWFLAGAIVTAICLGVVMQRVKARYTFDQSSNPYVLTNERKK